MKKHPRMQMLDPWALIGLVHYSGRGGAVSLARKAEATWHALRDAARRSVLAHMDETGWKVEVQLRWCVTPSRPCGT